MLTCWRPSPSTHSWSTDRPGAADHLLHHRVTLPPRSASGSRTSARPLHEVQAEDLKFTRRNRVAIAEGDHRRSTSRSLDPAAAHRGLDRRPEAARPSPRHRAEGNARHVQRRQSHGVGFLRRGSVLVAASAGARVPAQDVGARSLLPGAVRGRSPARTHAVSCTKSRNAACSCCSWTRNATGTAIIICSQAFSSASYSCRRRWRKLRR